MRAKSDLRGSTGGGVADAQYLGENGPLALDDLAV
jgi:hypothetical protein